MDKNIAALLREDAKTVHVVFDLSGREVVERADAEAFASALGDWPVAKTKAVPVNPKAKTYTYVTELDLANGDVVAVEANGQLQLAWVVHVDAEVKIAPDCPTKYKWVLSKVDLSKYHENEARNAEIEARVATAYKRNLRRGFREQILFGMGDEERDSVAALLAPKPKELLP
jgi:hypothetical protein